jgi:hypothetical protein
LPDQCNHERTEDLEEEDTVVVADIEEPMVEETETEEGTEIVTEAVDTVEARALIWEEMIWVERCNLAFIIFEIQLSKALAAESFFYGLRTFPKIY